MLRYLNVWLISFGAVLCLVLLGSIGCQAQPSPWPLPAETFEPAPTPPGTLPELIGVLTTGGAEARIGAARVIATMGPEAEEAIPVLIDNLSYEGPYDVRLAAAEALGAMGPAAKPAIPALINVMRDDFVHARRAAAEALGQIGDESAVPALAEALYDESSNVSVSAAKSLAELANQEFPELHNIGYSLDEKGRPIIVNAAKEWWVNEGQHQDWPKLDTLSAPE